MTFDPGPLAEVSRRPDGERWTLVFVRTFKHPPAKVWAALTEAEAMSRWSPFVTERDLDKPGQLTLTMVDGDRRDDIDAEVIKVDPPRLLEYIWGSDRLRWELAPSAEGTRLTLSHTLADRDWTPKVAAGWHLCLVVADHLLDGDPIEPIRGGAAMEYGFQDLSDAYERELES
jgi:uncharacterized protein YndB with AHSA1/START domain